MKSVGKGALLAGIMMILSGCAAKQWSDQQYGTNYGDAPAPSPIGVPAYVPEYGSSNAAAATMPTGAVTDAAIKIGTPYDVGGKQYVPADDPMYDDVGYASWYGPEMAGRQTANGEYFNPTGISTAHKTLPLPSYVEVTRLDTGQTILVRVNDRGPFAGDRVIDLSEGAARQLGIVDQGSVGVRVRRVTPPESERAALRAGRAVPYRLATPPELLELLNGKLGAAPRPIVERPSANRAPAPSNSGGRFIVEGGAPSVPANTSGYGTSYDATYGAAPAPVSVPVSAAPRPAAAASGGYVVQIGSFSSRARADELATRSGASVQPSEDGRLFRVRMGPYRTEAEAQKALEMVKAKGYPNARVFAD